MLVESGRRPLQASTTAGSLRVLVVHNRYRSEQPSGEDRVVEAEIALLRGAGVQVAEFTRHSDDIAAMSAVGKARVIAEIPWSRRAGRAFAARLQQVRPDLVHVHNTFPMVTASVLAAANTAAVPVVATLHNYRLVCPPGTLHRAGRTCDDCFGRAFPWPAVRHGCYRDSGPATLPLAVATAVNRRRWWTGVDRFFCISAAQRQLLIAAGMPADRLLVKHNFVPAPPVVRADAGEYFLYLGRLAQAKGVRLLMAAWDRFSADGTGPGLPLVIAGSGDLEPEVAAWAADRPDVQFLGLATRDECARLTARARAVVTPSQWPETFGLVVVEAAAAGVPTVAAAHGAFVELLSDGESGVLHEPGNVGSLCAALRTVADPATSVRMGQAARARYLAGFTEQIATTRLLEGYRSVLAGRPEVSL